MALNTQKPVDSLRCLEFLILDYFLVALPGQVCWFLCLCVSNEKQIVALCKTIDWGYKIHQPCIIPKSHNANFYYITMDHLHNRITFPQGDEYEISKKSILKLVKFPSLAAKCC